MNIGFIYAIAAAITWGLAYTIDQKILTGVSPLALLFTHSILAVLIMLPFMFFNDESTKIILNAGKMNWTLILISIALTTLANFMVFSSIKSLSASTASMIEIAYPFFVVLFSFILFRQTPNVSFLVGGLLIFTGSMVIIKFA